MDEGGKGRDASGGGGADGERRRDERLREQFESAFAMVEPFFDPAQGWGGHSLEHLAFRVVRDNFPDLSSEDVHALVVAAHRLYIERNPGGSGHLTRPEELRRPKL
ncbi:MAG: hypothetical protein BGO63_12475 [Candidatus Accumulibacter sp. 66-26]|nr:hypothetical protein [Accumulibacter sp.]OJW47402.1 MAG: hypothetical protein BGO63_12475 [Candidatus Accumulibacter sp. 66-26]